MSELDPWYLENLISPVDGSPLIWDSEKSALFSPAGRNYPVVEGVPVMLPENVAPTLNTIHSSRDGARAGSPWYLDSVLVSDEQKRGIQRFITLVYYTGLLHFFTVVSRRTS